MNLAMKERVTTTSLLVLLLLASKMHFDSISVSDYAACYYDSNWWIGQMPDLNSGEKDVQKKNFLHH